MAWKTLRVVVELPVEGDFTETDLRYLVERFVGESRMHAAINRNRSNEHLIKTGRARVMMFSRFMAAFRKKEAA
jgi:hypothetical protein